MTIKNANDLREKFGGVSLTFKWMGTEKKADLKDVNEVAYVLDAEAKFISVKKKLIDTRDKDYKKLTSIKSRIQALWRENTLPWIEPGCRLMQKILLESFQKDIFQPEKEALLAAVKNLNDRWPEILEDAPQRLGKLYCAQDYPKTLEGLFDVYLGFPNLEPPGYLPKEVFEQQSAKVQAQFEEALKLGEKAIATEFSSLVQRLAENLTPDADGKPKKFKDASVSSVYEFLERVKKLGFGSSEELSKSIEEVKKTLAGQGMKDLKELNADGLKLVADKLSQSVENLPRRKITIKKKSENESEAA